MGGSVLRCGKLFEGCYGLSGRKQPVAGGCRHSLAQPSS